MKKKFLSVFLALVMIVSLAPKWDKASAATGKFEPDSYVKALWMTTRFYGGQRMGEGPNWLTMQHKVNDTYNGGKSFLKDGDGSVNLTGGWFDCGDHVLFGQTFFYSAYMLALAYKTFPEGFHDLYNGKDYSDYMATNDWSINGGSPSGIPDVLEELKYATDWIIKATPNSSTFYSQKGNGDKDHQQWVTSGFMSTLNEANGGEKDKPREFVKSPNDGVMPAYAGATLAIMSEVYRDYDPAYANLCLEHAKNAYAYAKSKKGAAGVGAGGYYQAHKDSAVIFVLAASEMFMATNESTYKNDIKTGDLKDHWHVMDYSNSHDLAYYAAAMALPDQKSTILAQMKTNFVDKYTKSSNINGEGCTTLGGGWGELRYNGNTAFSVALYSKAAGTTAYDQYIYNQIDYIMGANNANQAFITGFDDPKAGSSTIPKQIKLPHHRNVFLDDRNANDSIKATMPIPERNKYFGYMVGGKRNSSQFSESITGYEVSEGGIDYNAGLVGALGYIVSQVSPASLAKCDCNLPDCNKCNPCTCKECGCERCYRDGKCKLPACNTCFPPCTTCGKKPCECPCVTCGFYPCQCTAPFSITFTAQAQGDSVWGVDFSGTAEVKGDGSYTVTIDGAQGNWYRDLKVTATGLEPGVSVTLGKIMLNSTEVTHSITSPLTASSPEAIFWAAWDNQGNLVDKLTAGHTVKDGRLFGAGGTLIGNLRLNFTVTGAGGAPSTQTTTPTVTTATPQTTVTTTAITTASTTDTTVISTDFTTASVITTTGDTVSNTTETTTGDIITTTPHTGWDVACSNCGSWFFPSGSEQLCANCRNLSTTTATTVATVTTVSNNTPATTASTATNTTAFSVTTTTAQVVIIPCPNNCGAVLVDGICRNCGAVTFATTAATTAAATAETTATTNTGEVGYKLGDVLGVNEPNIGGVLEILKYLANMKSRLDDESSFKAACITGGEKPVIGDVLELLKFLANMPCAPLDPVWRADKIHA